MIWLISKASDDTHAHTSLVHAPRLRYRTLPSPSLSLSPVEASTVSCCKPRVLECLMVSVCVSMYAVCVLVSVFVCVCAEHCELLQAACFGVFDGEQCCATLFPFFCIALSAVSVLPTSAVFMMCKALAGSTGAEDGCASGDCMCVFFIHYCPCLLHSCCLLMFCSVHDAQSASRQHRCRR